METDNSLTGRLIAAALLVALVTGGCGGSREATAPDKPLPLVYETGFADEFFVPDTTVRITLRYDRATGCFRVEGMGKSWIPLWPEGTEGISNGRVMGVDYPGIGSIFEGTGVRAMGAGWAHPLNGLVEEQDLNGCSANDGAFVITEIVAGVA